MPMTKEDVYEVFRYFASKEFDYVPINESDIDVIFSDEFINKMNKLKTDIECDFLKGANKNG